MSAPRQVAAFRLEPRATPLVPPRPCLSNLSRAAVLSPLMQRRVISTGARLMAVDKNRHTHT